METAPQLRAEQAELAWRRRQSESGAAFVNWPTPEDDTGSFPCRRCGTRIEHGKLIQGAYAEGISGALYLELPAIGLEPIPLGIRGLVLRVSGLLFVLVVGTGIYRVLGGLSLVTAFVVAVVALIAVQARANRRRQEENRSDIAERNRREVERVSRQVAGEDRSLAKER